MGPDELPRRERDHSSGDQLVRPGFWPEAISHWLHLFIHDRVCIVWYRWKFVVAPILGPTIGGWLTYNYSWRWVFYINLPIGILATLLCRTFLEDPPYLKRSSAANMDYIGFGLLGVSVASLQIMLDKGQELDWFGSKMIVWCAVIATVGFIALYRARTDHGPSDCRSSHP